VPSLSPTPLDIHNKEFSRAFRGYSEAEVDEFLDTVVKEFEGLIRENAELKDRLDEIERTVERYRAIEDTLNKTLLLAQQAAEDARAQGEREAALVRERAKLDAQRIIDEARERAKQALADYAEIRREAELFRMRMKTLLSAQLELFEEAALKGDDLPGVLVPEPEEEEREEAVALDFRRAEPARPNLWGEPVETGPRFPARLRPERAAPPGPSFSVEPAAGDEDEEDKDW